MSTTITMSTNLNHGSIPRHSRSRDKDQAPVQSNPPPPPPHVFPLVDVAYLKVLALSGVNLNGHLNYLP